MSEEMKRIQITNEVKTLEDSEGKALGDLEIEMIGSTGDMDRDGEVIDPKAWDIKNFKANPIILPQHDYKKPAIGRATKIKLQDGKLTFKIEFPPDGDNPEADIYRKLYKGGFMNASSVGFMPKEWVDGDGKKSPFRKFTKVELLELSLVSVPANPNAIMSAKKKGVVTMKELEMIGFEDKETKSNDPNLMLNEEHMKQHEEMSMFMSNVNSRLTYIEGFIDGIGKSVKSEEKFINEDLQEEKLTMDYIVKVLCGEPEAKSTEKVSTDEEPSLVKFIRGE